MIRFLLLPLLVLASTAWCAMSATRYRLEGVSPRDAIGSSNVFYNNYLVQNGSQADIGIYKYDPALSDQAPLEFVLVPGSSRARYELHEYKSDPVRKLAYADPNDLNVSGLGKLYNLAAPGKTWYTNSWTVTTDAYGRKLLGYDAGAGSTISTNSWKGFGPQRCSKEKNPNCPDPSWCGSAWCDGYVFMLCDGCFGVDVRIQLVAVR